MRAVLKPLLALPINSPFLCDIPGNRIQFGGNILVCDPEHAVALPRQPFGPSGIRLQFVLVAAAVELHDQPSFGATKIDDVGVNRFLASELQATKAPAAEDRPELPFRRGRLAAQAARGRESLGPGGVAYEASRFPRVRPALTPSPSPAYGRGEFIERPSPAATLYPTVPLPLGPYSMNRLMRMPLSKFRSKPRTNPIGTERSKM